MLFTVLVIFQGLFHPARKVREVYWKIYNNLYIGSQVRYYSMSGIRAAAKYWHIDISQYQQLQ